MQAQKFCKLPNLNYLSFFNNEKATTNIKNNSLIYNSLNYNANTH